MHYLYCYIGNMLLFLLLSSKKNIINRFTAQAMRKMEKNALSCSELTDMVTLWLCQSSSQSLFPFKSSQKVPELDPTFLKKCISYLILRHFSWIIKDLSQQTLLTLNQELKLHYKKMMVSSSFRTNATFQIFIIIIIKQTCHFLTQHFNNILTDVTLQSQMCIILFYTFLGLEVTQKTYEVMHRKYVCKGIGKQNMSKESFKSSKNSFTDGNPFKSSKKLTNFRFNKGSDQCRRSHQSIRKLSRDYQQKEQLQQFTLLLKENLHVDPLPPLKRKKRNIRELQHLNTQPCETMERSLSKSDELSPKKCIYSNQLSNSFKMCYPESLLFELTSKKVKLNQSFYNFKLEGKRDPMRQAEPERVMNRSLESQSSHAINGPKGCQNWQQIVRQLKKKTIDLKKKKKQQKKQEESPRGMQTISEQSSLRSTSYHVSPLPTLQKQHSNHNQQILKEIDSKQTFNECFKKQSHNKLTSSFSIKNFEEIQQKLMSNFFLKPKRGGLNKNSIRLDKDSFFGTCSVRKSQLLDAQKINLHADWIINHYKQ